MLEGGCNCGFVRYRMTSDPIFVNGCHCRLCQRTSGSAFAINAMIEADRVALIGEGAPEIAHPPENLPAGQTTARCPRCDTALWGHHQMFGEAFRFVHVGTLDAGEALAPDAHFFTRSKHPWVMLPDGVPAFETLPTQDDPPLWGTEAKARLDAAMGR